MSRSTLPLTPKLAQYLIDHSSRLSPTAERLLRETGELGAAAGMQVAPEEGLLLKMLVALTGARRVLEIGTFTGLSALMMAEGGAERIVCLDVSEEWTSIARRAWEAAGVSDRIELRLGSAIDSLEAMDRDETFDLVFIDADKPSYPTYYRMAMERLRSGGLIAVDNTLWAGRVVDYDDTSPDTAAIRAFNSMITTDERVEVVMLPIGDGLTLLHKRN